MPLKIIKNQTKKLVETFIVKAKRSLGAKDMKLTVNYLHRACPVSKCYHLSFHGKHILIDNSKCIFFLCCFVHSLKFESLMRNSTNYFYKTNMVILIDYRKTQQ